MIFALLLVIIGTTGLLLLGMHQPTGEFIKDEINTGWVWGVVVGFFIVGLIMAIPWMFVWGGFVDATMDNEQKFQGERGCDTVSEEISIGTVIVEDNQYSDTGRQCYISGEVLFGYFVSGFFTYLLCWRGAVAIVITLYPKNKVV